MIQAAVADIDVKVQPIGVRTPDDIQDGMRAAVRDRVQFLVVLADVTLDVESRRISSGSSPAIHAPNS